jgi:NADPH-dependent glutamate synthase beta subunit-like oxidoreductase/NAD(P)H-flavin reductase
MNCLHQLSIGMISSHTLKLNGFTFAELFQSEGLHRLDQTFLAYLNHKDPSLHQKLLEYRAQTEAKNSVEQSEFLIACARILENFIAELFDIQDEVAISQVRTTSFNPIAVFKKYFVLKRAKKEVNKASAMPPFSELNEWLQQELSRAPMKSEDNELTIALLGQYYLENPEQHAEAIEKLVQWCTQAIVSTEGKIYTHGFTSFHIPERIDFASLVPVNAVTSDKFGRTQAEDNNLRYRDGFKLTDKRMTAKEVQDEVNYCIYCHDHDGDFCSKGFPVKKGEPDKGFKKNALDVTLTGCPLEEKISEMHILKRDGHTLASLAMVMIDNPMCPATGHRICNDCMKACIYQKQDPVNIPQIETRVLTDVLDLPWGVEIYDLMTRWNPLRHSQYIMKPYNGLKVLIAGMGPAGFTIAHHLLLEGFAVVGFDGLKIEPLPETLIKEPIYRFADLKEALDERLMAGFGGVAEYGITVRWDKNFLKLIYLSLKRKPYFQVFGGVRFGGTITVEDAWSMGFDHFVLAVGAGLPKALPIPGSLAPGMRQANDFLMALQLGNAAKASSLTSLQIRMPAVIIGGGLTGVDTATEAQAYYISQVEKTLTRYEILAKEIGVDAINNLLDAPSKEILAEYLRHGHAVREERAAAKREQRQPDFIKLIREWGGVTIAYRRSMQESPAYINNHEELKKALEEGIYYLEGMEPNAVDLNEYGHSEALVCKKRVRNQDNEWVTTDELVRLPARSILVATGTMPNTAYEFEYRGTFNRLNLQYQHYEDDEGKLDVAHGVLHCKDPQFGPFTSYHKDDKRVSLIGDTHPVFHGNVVKAIASGMRTYPKILKVLASKINHHADMKDYHQFAAEMDHLFSARVTHIERKTPSIIEISIQAPLAAKHFQPGQFFRLQNFETLAPHIDHTLIQMEPLALVGAECDHHDDTIHFLVHESSATSKLVSMLKKHEPVSLMGPTGVRAKIPEENETVLIIGSGTTSLPFLRSYGPEMRKAGNKVLYIGQFNHRDEVFCRSQMENAADVIIYQVKNGLPVEPNRHHDCTTTGNNIINAMIDYANGKLNTAPQISLKNIDRVYVVGTSDLLREFQAARKQSLKQHLIKDPKVIGSVYGNMQCMLKGVCAQCLQWQIDPETGHRTKAVFACSWQDQPLEIIDIDHIDARQMQNRLLDQLGSLWVDHLFAKFPVTRV